MTPNGVLCTWMDELHVIPYTFAQVFPYVDQFNYDFMIASISPIYYHRAYMDQAVANYLPLAHSIFGDSMTSFPSSEYVLSRSHFSRNRDQILVDEKNNKILSDLTPWLEYYFFVHPTSKEIVTSRQSLLDFESRIK